MQRVDPAPAIGHFHRSINRRGGLELLLASATQRSSCTTPMLWKPRIGCRRHLVVGNLFGFFEPRLHFRPLAEQPMHFRLRHSMGTASGGGPQVEPM